MNIVILFESSINLKRQMFSKILGQINYDSIRLLLDYIKVFSKFWQQTLTIDKLVNKGNGIRLRLKLSLMI